ncbi:MAG: carbohydrate binding family 9 domain-containing protein [Saprospiraceae bacterium]|nr:carbohydrate binding family 9 domain-containing protein [Saprospiraceae bacterium]
MERLSIKVKIKAMGRIYLIFLYIIFGGIYLSGQSFSTKSLTEQLTSAKTLTSKRATTSVKIDGILDEGEWQNGSQIKHFSEFRPNPGHDESETHKTEAYLLYDDLGIYFGGFCHEKVRDSISTELTGRDGFGNNDFVGIIFDTYKDNINAFEYFVTPLNEQWDAKQAPNNNGDSEDFSWNAVWESATKIHDNGWSFEIFIPFASIRFPKKEIQDWGLNVTRRRQITGEQFFWNHVDQNINGFLTQEGYWTGLTNIKPPIRLQLSPYLSYYTNHFPSNLPDKSNYTTQVNGGMDLKWGINQSFTLDATLIPDFGQVQSDAQVLNLTPFEVRFNENRSFFTEGTELFNKGGLFYSRRIGGTPINLYSVYDQLGNNESVISNPTETKLLNATKISGRTQHGLGIGVLNAVTSETTAIIENKETGEKRSLVTDPLTNYNVFVLNKSLKYNSSVSLINTNVLRTGSTYDANVSAFLFDINDKTNTWNVGGSISSSQILHSGDKKNTFGYYHSLYAGKTSGKVRYNIWQELADKSYTSNDLGYFTNSNYMIQGVWIGFRRPEPKGWSNNMNTNINMNFSRLLTPFGSENPMYQAARIQVNINAQHKKLSWMGLNLNYSFAENDFYEPRVANRYFRRGHSALVGYWFESNTNKKYSVSPEIYIRRYFNFYNGTSIDMNLFQNWRVNNKLSLRLGISVQPRFNNVGFSTFESNEPVFAVRDIDTYETSLRTKYNFTNRMGVSMVARHYIRSIENKMLFNLKTDGSLTENDLTPTAQNRTVNFFNIDLVYTWQIAQGSFVNVVWKNAIGKLDAVYNEDYFSNLSSTLRGDQNNNISVKVIYFLDYHTIASSRKKSI